MINWEAFAEPEVWKALGRVAWSLAKALVSLANMFLAAMALWYGFSIGKEGDWFHMVILPLKRFFF